MYLFSIFVSSAVQFSTACHIAEGKCDLGALATNRDNIHSVDTSYDADHRSADNHRRKIDAAHSIASDEIHMQPRAKEDLSSGTKRQSER